MHTVYLLIVILCTIVQIHASEEDEDESDYLDIDLNTRRKPVACETRDRTQGYCVSVVRCRRIMSNIRRFQNPRICFFQRDIPYVCCPLKLKSDRQTSKPTRSTSKPIRQTPKPTRPVTPSRMVITPAPTRQPVTNREVYRPPTTPKPRPNNVPQSTKIEINGPSCGKRPYIPPQGSAFVVGGRETEKYSWPWMAAIRVKTYGENSQFLCGGSLITSKHVLTAAHCFGEGGGPRRPADYTIVLGSHYRGSDLPGETPEEGITMIKASQINVHEEYRDEAHDNDVAVIVLSRSADLSARVLPVCLPSRSRQRQEPTTVTVIGWGDLSFGGVGSKTLQEASFAVVPYLRCRDIFRNVPVATLSRGITSSMLCAGDLYGNKDACQNDSGGPLLEESKSENKYYQVGIVSFGFRCAEKGFPGVYAKVSNYVPWIQRQVRQTT